MSVALMHVLHFKGFRNRGVVAKWAWFSGYLQIYFLLRTMRRLLLAVIYGPFQSILEFILFIEKAKLPDCLFLITMSNK